jgi:DNA gyrase subunit A
MADQPTDPIAAQKIPANIADEMRQSYMDYAMSVIIGRALPDIRDGLKPANRRVLYGMQQMGLQPGRPYRKCAKVAGEVMGNYHPHGEGAIYDTLVRMAQDWNMRAPLVDGQGNFGSVDGDPPAAMRYTEARLTRLGSSMMADIEKDTVEYQPTYDNSSTEPTVLPTVLPNLLVNGAEGIAVGMATKIPPHNLGEVVDALAFLLAHPELTPEERLEGVMERVTGPDFPTAGFICGRAGIRQAYRTGRGTIVMRARAEIEVRKGDKEAIVITEIPYQVNKAKLIEKIAELVKDKRVEGIADIRDESSREGMRIVLDIKRGEPSQVILNNLYKLTPLQDTFGIIFLAIVDQRPRVLNLLEACDLFVDFRREVVRRRTQFELRKAEARAHILEGYVIALDHLDEVIALIRGSRTPLEARTSLITQFALTEIQADAILELQLQRLTGLERAKIVDELQEIKVLITDLRDILQKPRRVDQIVGDELQKIREDHADSRRTEIQDAVDEITIEDMIADEDVAISITHTGYIKRTSLGNYRAQRRGGRGRVGMKTKDEDFVANLFIASTHSYLLFFTDRGRVYWRKVHEIPDVGPQGKGKAIVNLVSLQAGEKIAAVCAVKDFETGGHVFLATRKGIVKKTELSAFSNPRPSGIIALGVEEGDIVIEATLTTGEDEILLATREGMAIRFREADVRPMGRNAYGVKGIELEDTDQVVGMQVVTGKGTLLTATENGFGKRTDLDEYRVQSRGGKGLIDIKTTPRNGRVVGVELLRADEGVMLITEKGMIIRLNTADISTIGRNTQGVRLIQLEEGDRLVGMARLAEREEGEESSPPPSIQEPS